MAGVHACYRMLSWCAWGLLALRLPYAPLLQSELCAALDRPEPWPLTARRIPCQSLTMTTSPPNQPSTPSSLMQTGMLLLSLVLAYATAALGALASADAGAFYRSLNQPSWAPPAWLFGPVWSLLYTLMAVAAWLVWRRQGWRAARGALLLYLIHLPVNGAWSWIFFVGQHGAWATVTILILLLMVMIMALLFWRQQRLAASLLLPYLAWVAFASMLCLSLWRMNPLL